MGQSAAEGHRAWHEGSGRGGFVRALWLAATVLMAIPIFALLVVAVLAAIALTFAALLVAWLWGVLIRIGAIRPRHDVTVIRVSPPRSDH